MAHISIIIPVYNGEKHLNECLDSVINQTYEDIEIICVDDGSTDSSPKILEKYREKDKRVKVIYQKNSYAGVARNNGINHAEGKYLMFLDSDDCYKSNAVELMLKRITESGADVVKACFEYVDEVKKEISTSRYSLQKTLPDEYHNKVISFNEETRGVQPGADVPWNGIYRRGFVTDNHIEYNNLRSVNDHSFFIHCWIAGAKFLVIDDVIAQYRRNNSESLVGKKYKNFDNQISNYNIVKEICQNEKLEDDAKKAAMQQELMTLFNWYKKTRKTAIEASGTASEVDEKMTEFLKAYDQDDVGEEYINSFKHNDLYKFLTQIDSDRSGAISSFINKDEITVKLEKQTKKLEKKMGKIEKARAYRIARKIGKLSRN